MKLPVSHLRLVLTLQKRPLSCTWGWGQVKITPKWKQDLVKIKTIKSFIWPKFTSASCLYLCIVQVINLCFLDEWITSCQTLWIQKENLTQILFLLRETKSIFSKTSAQGWDMSKYKFPKYNYDPICFILYLYYYYRSDKKKKKKIGSKYLCMTAHDIPTEIKQCLSLHMMHCGMFTISITSPFLHSLWKQCLW